MTDELKDENWGQDSLEFEAETERFLKNLRLSQDRRTRRQLITWLRARGARFYHDAAAYFDSEHPRDSLNRTLTDMGKALLAAADDLEEGKDP